MNVILKPIDSNRWNGELAVFLVALAAVLPSLGIGPLSDDFSWLAQAKSAGDGGFFEYLSQPAPFGYFRPLPLLFFRISWLLFGGLTWLYHLLPVSLHAASSLLVLKILRLLKYDKRTAFLSALIFSILPCHAEALFWLCSVNELFSAFFILSGIYLLLRSGRPQAVGLASLSFLLALLSRESAFCFVPLLALIKTKAPKMKWSPVAWISGLVTAVYAGLRVAWLTGLPPSFRTPHALQLDLNPIGLASRLAQYLLKMLLPAKSIMEFFDFRIYDALRDLYLNPSANRTSYWSLNALALSILAAVLWFLLMTRKKGLIFGLLFSLAALLVYLPFYNPSERFLYLPSVGIAFIVALILHMLFDKGKRTGIILTAAVISIYTSALFNRQHRWIQVSDIHRQAVTALHGQLRPQSEETIINIADAPSHMYGVPFISVFTFNDAWSYLYPGSRTVFIFDEKSGTRGIPGFAFDRRSNRFLPSSQQHNIK
jgi:hypothetical protein